MPLYTGGLVRTMRRVTFGDDERQWTKESRAHKIYIMFRRVRV